MAYLCRNEEVGDVMELHFAAVRCVTRLVETEVDPRSDREVRKLHVSMKNLVHGIAGELFLYPWSEIPSERE